MFPGEVEGATITVDDDGEADHSSIQAAIDNASEGDIIEVRQGEYLEELSINRSLSLRGEGPERTILRAPRENASQVVVITGDRVEFSGFLVTGGGIGIYVQSSNNTIVKNNCSFNGAGIWASKSSSGPANNTFTNNVCFANQWAGLQLLTNGHNNTLENNRFIRNGWEGVILRQANGNVFRNCSFTGNGVSGGDGGLNGRTGRNGIYLHSSSGNLLENCQFSGNHGDGILIYTSRRSNTIKACESSHNGGNGIQVMSDAGIVVLDTRCSGNTLNGSYIHSDSVHISNISCSRNGLDGMVLSDCDLGTVVENSSFELNSVGLLIRGSIDVQLSNSSSSSNRAAGVLLVDSWGSNVSHNLFSQNLEGVRVQETRWLDPMSPNLFTRNQIVENREHGVLLNTTSRNSFVENNCSKNARDGFHLLYCNSTTIQNNTLSENNFGIFFRYRSEDDKEKAENLISGNVFQDNEDTTREVFDEEPEFSQFIFTILLVFFGSLVLVLIVIIYRGW